MRGLERLQLAEDVTVYVADCRDALRTLPADSIQCCVTSIPYYGLRDYGLPPSVWGGDPGCQHEWGLMERGKRKDILPEEVTTLEARLSTDDRQGKAAINGGRFCTRCGAWLGCLGLEPTLPLYVEHVTEVFQEVRRVLRSDGLLWLNIGDSYNGSGGAGGDYGPGGLKEGQPKFPGRKVEGMKAKDLMLVPFEVARSLRADGWYLRANPPWLKANAMPESVTDRPAIAHEEWFQFGKSGIPQFWTHRDSGGARTQPAPDYRWLDGANDDAETDQEPPDWRTETLPNGKRRWRRINLWTSHDCYYDGVAVRVPSTNRPSGNAKRIHGDQYGRPGEQRGYSFPYQPDGTGRGRRTTDWWNESVDAIIEWADHLRHVREHGGMLLDINGEPMAFHINPEQTPFAHFATFPTKMIEPIILASTSTQACPTCGAPWTRITVKRETDWGKGVDSGRRSRASGEVTPIHHNTQTRTGYALKVTEPETTGRRPTCICENNDGSGTCAVLDPFAGSGTALLVAARLGRQAIGCEMNPGYVNIMRRRLSSGKAQRKLVLD